MQKTEGNPSAFCLSGNRLRDQTLSSAICGRNRVAGATRLKPSKKMLYGIAGAVCIVAAAGAFYVFNGSPEAATAGADAAPAASRRAAAPPADAIKEDRIASLLAKMRAAVASQDFAAANSALNEAERLDVQSPTVQQARVELHRARDPERRPPPKE